MRHGLTAGRNVCTMEPDVQPVRSWGGPLSGRAGYTAPVTWPGQSVIGSPASNEQGMMRQIPLNNGMTCMVDDEDFPLVSQFNWWADKDRNTYYAVTKVRQHDGHRKRMSMHRLILSAKADETVDHENQNGLDNRRSNLRMATREENASNRRVGANYKGIYQSKKSSRWYAVLTCKQNRYRSKVFATPIEAAIAYDMMAIQYHGDFASLNFPESWCWQI